MEARMEIERIIDAVKREVYQRYPEMRGIEPEVEEQAGIAPSVAGPTTAAHPSPRRFSLTFKKRLEAEGAVITEIVRATADQEGRIIKVISSR